MRWDQGILTFTLTVAVTLIGVAACGPSSQDRTVFLANAGNGRRVDPCVTKIGSRNEKVVGGEKKEVSVPVCGIPLDAETKDYKAVALPVGYKVGVTEKKKLSVSVEIGIELSAANTDEETTSRVVDLISKTCREKILKLWSDSRLDADLSIVLEPVTAKTSHVYDHILYLDGTPSEGFVMAHWPDRARFRTTTGAESLAKCANTARGEERNKCRRLALQSNDDVNTDFCIQLTQMTSHYLGLAFEDAKAGKCLVSDPTEKASKKVQGKGQGTEGATSKTILDALKNPDLRGPKFWAQARFTRNDRKTILNAACGN